MKRVKFLKKGPRAIHGQPREPQFYHQVGDEKDLDNETARVAVEAGAAEYVDAPELEDGAAGDGEEKQAGDEPEKTGVLRSWFGAGSDAPAPAPEPEAVTEAVTETEADDGDAGGIPPALE